MQKNSLLKKVVAILIIISAVIIYLVMKPKAEGPIITTKTLGSATYLCTEGKTIQASYYDTDQAPEVAQNGQPVPHGSVALSLSDGRTVTLPQTISASGVRYADATETIVFWNKGVGVTFTENGQQTFIECLEVVKDPGNLPQAYGNGGKGMTLRYPSGYTVDENYTYQDIGPAKNIRGVKFTIPSSMATGTNLSTDSYISIEQITSSTTCSASLFLDQGQAREPQTIIENGVTLSVSSSTGAAAGNRYEETVYAFPGSNPCLAVRYFVHYGAIANYPSTVKEFDKAALLNQFDAIRKTFIAVQ